MPTLPPDPPATTTPAAFKAWAQAVVDYLESIDTGAADLLVPDEAYNATNWNGSLEVPTKNAVRDKIESVSSDIAGILDGATFTGDIIVPDEAYGAGWNGSLEVPTKNAVYDKIETVSGGGGGGTRVIVVKSADESVTSSTTVQDDDELLFAIGASETWVGTFYISYEADPTGDIKFGLTAPAGATFLRMLFGPATSSTTDPATDVRMVGSTSGTANGLGGTGSGQKVLATMHVSVVNSTTPGNVVLQWAQNASNATASKVHAGSFLVFDLVE